MSCILRQATRARAFLPAHLPKNWQSPQRSLWAKSSRYANPTRVSLVGVAWILRRSNSMSEPSGRGPTIRRYTSRQLGAVPAADSLSSKASSTSSTPATAQRSVYAAGHVHGRRPHMIWPSWPSWERDDCPLKVRPPLGLMCLAEGVGYHLTLLIYRS